MAIEGATGNDNQQPCLPTYPKESDHYGQVAPLVNAQPNAFVSRVQRDLHRARMPPGDARAVGDQHQRGHTQQSGEAARGAGDTHALVLGDDADQQ